MFHSLCRFSTIVAVCFLISVSPSANAQPSAFQGFELPADLTCWSGSGTITRVPSTGGTLGLTSFDGSYHAEITDTHDGYMTGYGDSQYTRFCLPASVYVGDFSQNIAVYIKANWPAAAASGVPSFWIDEAPRDATTLLSATGQPPEPYTAEHSFRFTATGTSVQVAADDQPAFFTITTSGWYVFQMTWRKAAVATDPVLTDFRVWQAGDLYGLEGDAVLLATTTRPAGPVSPALALPSSQLGGPSYLWFTVWQNGFAGDVLAIDDASVGGLGTPQFPPIFPWWWFFF